MVRTLTARQRIASRVATRFIWAGLHNLRPNERLTVYHGTSLSEIFDLINGFDANRVHSRMYGGPRHAGLFVSPDPKLAERFAHYGEIVLEIVVQAKNLHGVDYSGNIGRHQRTEESTKEWLQEKYPDSFRPYLSLTMLQSQEPQSLLRGLVRPNQIKRVRYKPHGKAAKWYTRRQFLDLDLEATPAKHQPYGRKEKVRDIGFDLSNPRYSLDEFMEAMAAALDVDINRVKRTLQRYAKLPRDRAERGLMDLIERAGFGQTAARSFQQKMLAII